MYDLLKDDVRSYDGGPTVLNCWLMLNNELGIVKRAAVS